MNKKSNSDQQEKHELLNNWFVIKEHRHRTEAKNLRKVKEGEIWWVAVGENVGVEINGKSEYFSRPVLVFKKLSHLGFLGVPLSTQKHNGSWYVGFRFQGKDICAVLSQVRVFSSARLYERMGHIAEDDFMKIKNGFQNLYLPE